jgi:hypothetical protein
VDDCLVELCERSSVEVASQFADLPVESVDLHFVFLSLGVSAVDGVPDAFSSGLQGLVVSLKSHFLKVDSIDLVVESHIIGV